MPKGRLATAAQKRRPRSVERPVVTRKSGRDKVPTEKGSSYTAALRSNQHKQQQVDNQRPSTSCGKAKAAAGTSRRQGKDNSDKDSDVEVESDHESHHSDDELLDMLARAKVVMSVIDKLAEKIKSKSMID